MDDAHAARAGLLEDAVVRDGLADHDVFGTAWGDYSANTMSLAKKRQCQF